jgi:ABC-type phosphate transport system auxiliary subunit
MMPAFVKGVLRKISAGIVLLVVAALLLAWPARHVLEPLWPGPVEELLYLEAGGGTGRVLVPVRHAAILSRSEPMLARNRPLSLVRVETIDGSWQYGYLLGVSSVDDRSLRDDVPEQLLETVVELLEPDYDIIVLVCAEGQRFEIAVSEVRRLIYPNRLVLTDRVHLAWQRLAARIAERLSDGEVMADNRGGTASPG